MENSIANPSNNNASLKERQKPYYLQNFASQNSGTNRVFSIVPYLAAKGVIITYENSIIWQNLEPNFKKTEPPERFENDIKSFSIKSRRRLFNIFTTLSYSNYGQPRFVSATWHYDAPDHKTEIKSFLERYIKRLKRNLPAFHAIWKLEYQERGTPHFHFMIFPLDKKTNLFDSSSGKIIQDNWLELKSCKCEHCKLHSIKVVPLNEYKHAIIYISKEIAKLQDNYCDHNLGRIWGTSRNLKINPIEQIECTYADYQKLLGEIIKNDKTEEKTKLFAEGLRGTDQSSRLYICNNDIKLELINLKSVINKKKNLPTYLTMKKYKLSPDTLDKIY
jgi:hypothetical protein